MGHPNVMATHPHYAPNSQAHFGVATPVYPPSSAPGYYPGGSPSIGAQGQYVGGTGLAGVGVPAAPQSQMQFAAQNSATLSQAPTFATFSNAHALPTPSSGLVQAGAGTTAGQFLPGAHELFFGCLPLNDAYDVFSHPIFSTRTSTRRDAPLYSFFDCSRPTVPLQHQRWQLGCQRGPARDWK